MRARGRETVALVLRSGDVSPSGRSLRTVTVLSTEPSRTTGSPVDREASRSTTVNAARASQAGAGTSGLKKPPSAREKAMRTPCTSGYASAATGSTGASTAVGAPSAQASAPSVPNGP